jgi:hypothetical protein
MNSVSRCLPEKKPRRRYVFAKGRPLGLSSGPRAMTSMVVRNTLGAVLTKQLNEFV